MSGERTRSALRLVVAGVILSLTALAPAPAQERPPEGVATEPPVAADDVIPERREDGSRPRIRSRDLRKLLDRELSIIETLEDLQFGLKKKAHELEEVQKKRAEVERELQEFEVLFEAEKARLAAHRVLARKRLRALSSLERAEELYLAFSAEGFTDLLRRERLLERLAGDDRERVREYKDALAHFRRSELELRRRRDELARVELEIATAKTQIEQDQSDRRELLRRVDEEREYYEKYHSELRRRSKEVAKKIATLDGWTGHGWFDGHKGKYRTPFRNALVKQPYGYKVHPRFGTKVLHRGITFHPGKLKKRADGTPVKKLAVHAIYQGKVIYAGWLSGYGSTVIVDHAKGYYTLYAGLNRIKVEQGEVIDGRETIGYLGGGGRALRHAELYFEIRVEGQPVNPEPWLL